MKKTRKRLPTLSAITDLKIAQIVSAIACNFQGECAEVLHRASPTTPPTRRHRLERRVSL